MDARVSLRELLPNSRFVGGEDVAVSRLVREADQCQPGDLLAILSHCDDPTEAGCQAMARGAVGLITEQLLPVPLPQCIVRDADRAAAHVCDALFDQPADDLLVIGVVGGHGKTTTALLVSNLLRSQGIRTAYDTDLGQCDGIVQSTPSTRLPNVSATCEFMADARDAGSTIAVVELSDRLVRSAAFDHLAFDVLILTGGGSKRPLDGFCGTIEDLALARLKEGGAAIVNGDCAVAMAAVDHAGVPSLTFAMRGEADVTAKIFDQQPGETTLVITAGEVTTVLESNLTGPAMASCQLAAVATGLLMEMPIEKAISATSSLRIVPGRMQRFAQYEKATVVLDACGSSTRLAAVLRGLRRELNGGRLWVVASGNAEADPAEIAAMGRIAEKFADRAIVTIESQYKGDFLRLAHSWLDGVQKTARPRLIADRESAIQWALAQADSRDTILIAGGWSNVSPADHRAGIENDANAIARWMDDASETNLTEPIILPFSSAK
jgi:UDP-N-acetylmuramoyl-L-alanyl-D-glutamate--2,6-diaminopimelate ligase